MSHLYNTIKNYTIKAKLLYTNENYKIRIESYTIQMNMIKFCNVLHAMELFLRHC